MSPGPAEHRDPTMDFTAETDEPAKSSGSLPKFNQHRFLLTAGIALVALVALIAPRALERSLAADDGRDRRQPQGRIRPRRGRRPSERAAARCDFYC